MTHCSVCRSGQVIDSRRALWMCVWHVSLFCVIWLIILCDMTHCDACQIWASQQQEIRSGCGCAMTDRSVWHDTLSYEKWPLILCDMTHCDVCQIWASQHQQTRSGCVCDMTHHSVWHDTILCEMTPNSIWHDSLWCVSDLGTRHGKSTTVDVAWLAVRCATSTVVNNSSFCGSTVHHHVDPHNDVPPNEMSCWQLILWKKKDISSFCGCTFHKMMSLVHRMMSCWQLWIFLWMCATSIVVDIHRMMSLVTHASRACLLLLTLIERTPPPVGVSYLLCSLIKNRV